MKNITTLAEIEDKFIGKRGTPRREAYESELEDIMIGMQLRDARINLDLTQEELAERINKKRSYVSRVESDNCNITIKSLRNIVENGLGGKLKIQIQF